MYKIKRVVLLIHEMKQSLRVPMILCGNKSDLIDQETDEMVEEATMFSKEWDLPFVCTSARSGEKASEVFQMLAQLIAKRWGPGARLMSDNVMFPELPSCCDDFPCAIT